MKCRNDIELDRELVESLIEQIKVYSGKKVEVIFKYNKNELFHIGER